MVARAAIVAGLLVLPFVAGFIVRERARRRSYAMAGMSLPAQIGSRLNSSGGGIVYFYGPHCSTCRLQSGVLEELADANNIPILRIDASSETCLADDLGVKTVPATVVVDRSKTVRSVNFGFRSADALREQVLTVSAE